MRLRTKLILWFGLVLSVALALNNAVTIYNLRTSLLEESVGRAQTLMEILEATDQFVAGLPEKAQAVMGSQMLVQALLAAHLVDIAENDGQLSPARIVEHLKDVTERTEVDEFWITDSKGHAYIHTVDGVDFTFPTNPTANDQAYHFRELMDGSGRQFVQQTIPREIDGVWYKYAGVSGIDRPRIVQVGQKADSLTKLTSGLRRADLLKAMVGKGALERVLICDGTGAVEVDAGRDRLSEKGTIQDPALLADVKAASTNGKPSPRLAGDRLYVTRQFSSAAAPAVIVAVFNARPLNDTIRSSVGMTLLSFIIVLVLGIAAAATISRGITRPVSGLASAADHIAQGDLATARDCLEPLGGTVLTEEVTSESADETKRLLTAIASMADGLNKLVGRIQESGLQVSDASARISASVHDLEATATEQSAATGAVHQAAKDISSNTKELAKTMSSVSIIMADSASLVASGRGDLEVMSRTMQQMDEATSSISSKLTVIQQKATNITSFVDIMNKVSEQTNLLSLNAAIEAEKAGEYGRGFSVVAREIRRLAERTAAAAAHIQRAVEDMEVALVTGGREMDRFRSEVNISLSETARISSELGRILDRVQGLKPQFDEANQGVQIQSENAEQIAEAMFELNDAARMSADSIHEFGRVTAYLNQVSGKLEKEVSRFRVATVGNGAGQIC